MPNSIDDLAEPSSGRWGTRTDGKTSLREPRLRCDHVLCRSQFRWGSSSRRDRSSSRLLWGGSFLSLNGRSFLGALGYNLFDNSPFASFLHSLCRSLLCGCGLLGRSFLCHLLRWGRFRRLRCCPAFPLRLSDALPYRRAQSRPPLWSLLDSHLLCWSFLRRRLRRCRFCGFFCGLSRRPTLLLRLRNSFPGCGAQSPPPPLSLLRWSRGFRDRCRRAHAGQEGTNLLELRNFGVNCIDD